MTKKGHRKKKTVLVVDDERSWLLALKLVLKEHGFAPIAVNSGEEALSVLKNKKPDLILSDVRMPAMNGFDLLEKIRENPQLTSVPVIFMSAIDDYDAKKVAKDLKAAAYVTKPLSNEDLKKTVEVMLEQLKSK